MVRVRRLGAALCVLMFVAGVAHGQKATERYIPIGASPGLAAPYTLIGQIEAVEVASRTLTISAPTGRRAVEVSDLTKIWLDKSGLRQSNAVGSFGDCVVGRTVEVKYREESGRPHPRRAEWLKIRVDPTR